MTDMNRSGSGLSRHRVLGAFLAVVGLVGCACVAFLIVVFPFIAVNDPKIGEMLLLAALGIPFVTYIVTVRNHWHRRRALFVGSLAHLSWLLFLKYPGDDGQFLIGAIALFAIFLWYSFGLPLARHERPKGQRS